MQSVPATDRDGGAWTRLVRSELRRLRHRRLIGVGGPALLGLVVFGMVAAALLIDTGGNAPSFVEIAIGEPPSERVQIFGPLVWLALVGGFVAGAVNIGVELRTRAIETTLTWLPDRRRLLVGKLVAQSVVLAGGALLVAFVYVSGLCLLTVRWGTVGPIPFDVWMQILTTSVRLAVSTALFGVFGLCLTVMARSALVVSLLFVLWAGQLEPLVRFSELGVVNWLPVHSAGAFVAGTGTSADYLAPGDSSYDHGLWFVGAVLTAYLAVAVLAAGWALSRRDFA